MRIAIAVVLALSSTIALHVGFFVQHGASSALPKHSLAHPLRALRSLFGHARWRSGYAMGFAGWGLYIAALRFGPLSIVQSIGAGGIGLLAILSWRAASLEPSGREKLAALLAVGGLVLVGATLGSKEAASHPTSTTVAILWIVGCSLAATIAASPVSRPVIPRAAGLGCAAGLLYATGDIATKGAVDGSGLWYLPVLVVGHFLGFVALQLAFQAGSSLTTAGLASMWNNVVPIVAGVALFHERLPGGVLGVVRVVGFAAAVFGGSLIAQTSKAVPFEPV